MLYEDNYQEREDEVEWIGFPRRWPVNYFSGEAVTLYQRDTEGERIIKAHVAPFKKTVHIDGCVPIITTKGIQDLVNPDDLERRFGWNLYVFRWSWLIFWLITLLPVAAFVLLPAAALNPRNFFQSAVQIIASILELVIVGAHATIIGVCTAATSRRAWRLFKLWRIFKFSSFEKRQREKDTDLSHALIWPGGFCSGQAVYCLYRGEWVCAHINHKRWQPTMKGYVPIIFRGKHLLVNADNLKKRIGVNRFVLDLHPNLKTLHPGCILWGLFLISVHGSLMPVDSFLGEARRFFGTVYAGLFMICLAVHAIDNFLLVRRARRDSLRCFRVEK